MKDKLTRVAYETEVYWEDDLIIKWIAGYRGCGVWNVLEQRIYEFSSRVAKFPVKDIERLWLIKQANVKTSVATKSFFEFYSSPAIAYDMLNMLRRI